LAATAAVGAAIGVRPTIPEVQTPAVKVMAKPLTVVPQPYLVALVAD